MPQYRLYQGKEIFTLSDRKQEAIIEGLLYENDSILLVAPPKMSKTVLAVQMACSLSSGTAFLDSLEIPAPVKVMYIATEMKDEDLKDRFIRTSNHIKTNPANLILICTKGGNFKFNTNSGRKYIAEIVALYKANPPKVIFIDSVYKAFYGSLTKDDIVNEFLGEVDRIAAEFDSAVVMVHHTRKETRDKDGFMFEESDTDTYGSQFLLGSVDSVLRLEKVRKEKAPLDRILKCDTQRSGNIISDLRIRLAQPDPLYFYPVDIYETEKSDIMAMFTTEKQPISIAEIIQKTKLSRAKVYRILKSLLENKSIAKTGGKVKLYGIKS
jgi:RecA-family ATPase